MLSAKKSRISLLAASVAVMAVAGASFASTATAEAAPAPKANRSAVVTVDNALTPAVKRLVKGSGAADEAKAVTQYWTPQRMKAAVSLDAVEVKGKRSSISKATTKGATGSVAGQAPKVTPKVVEDMGITPQYDYPNLPYYHPTARTNGKIFFTRGSGSYVCSGSIVNTEGKSSIWTAGHCLFDNLPGSATRVWSSNVTFVPSYSNGYRPYGTWTARQLWVTSAWYYNRDFSQDNGSFTVNRNWGYRIADYLGAQGITWNASANYYSTAFGYPQAYPFNGQYLVRATGNTGSAGSTIYMYSGLTGGSSGGPWLRNYNASTGYGYINGHNDFIYTSSPAWMYSPYYGNQVSSLYNAVRYATS